MHHAGVVGGLLLGERKKMRTVNWLRRKLNFRSAERLFIELLSCAARNLPRCDQCSKNFTMRRTRVSSADAMIVRIERSENDAQYEGTTHCERLGSRRRPNRLDLVPPDDCELNLPAGAALGLAGAGTPRSSLILPADPIAVGILVAAVTVTTVVAVAVVIVAVSGGTGCRGSYCCRTNRRSAIRIIPATIGNPAIGCPAIRGPSIGRPSIGYAAARNANSTAPDTCRANPSASTNAAATVGERVVGNKGHAHQEGGRETYDSITQHCCTPSLAFADDEQRGVVIHEVNLLGNGRGRPRRKRPPGSVGGQDRSRLR